jgi:hypothetical protein
MDRSIAYVTQFAPTISLARFPFRPYIVVVVVSQFVLREIDRCYSYSLCSGRHQQWRAIPAAR